MLGVATNGFTKGSMHAIHAFKLQERWSLNGFLAGIWILPPGDEVGRVVILTHNGLCFLCGKVGESRLLHQENGLTHQSTKETLCCKTVISSLGMFQPEASRADLVYFWSELCYCRRLVLETFFFMVRGSLAVK